MIGNFSKRFEERVAEGNASDPHDFIEHPLLHILKRKAIYYMSM